MASSPKLLDTAAWLDGFLSDDFELEIERFGRTRVEVGWQLENRAVDEFYLGYLLRGKGALEVAHYRGEFLPWDVFLIGPGVAHNLKPLGEERFQFYHWRFRPWRRVDGQRVEWLWGREAMVCRDVAGVRALLDTAFSVYSGESSLRTMKTRALLCALLAEIVDAELIEGQSGLSHPRRQHLMHWLHGQIETGGVDIAPRDLAAQVGLSEDYFSRAFKQSFGIPPRTWIVRERIQYAAGLLRSSRASITEVSTACGFTSPYLFSRQFRQFTGVSPRNYRAR